MKMVIVNGSPDKFGDTQYFIDEVVKDFEGEIIQYNPYFMNFKACVDCRYCQKNFNECCIKDDFQQFSKDVVECDLLVVASPLHFSCFSGQLLSLFSRFQTVFMTRDFEEELEIKPKKAITIVVGGNKYPNMFGAIPFVDRILYIDLNVVESKRLLVNNTDKQTLEQLTIEHMDTIKELRNFIL